MVTPANVKPPVLTATVAVPESAKAVMADPPMASQRTRTNPREKRMDLFVRKCIRLPTFSNLTAVYRDTYGPLTIATLTVLLYVSAMVLAGMLTVIAGVMVNLPRPLLAAALKNFTGVGAVVPAGTPVGYVPLLLGLVQWAPPLIHDTVGAVWILEALVASVFAGFVPVKVVEVIVRFQPAALPLASVTVSPSE